MGLILFPCKPPSHELRPAYMSAACDSGLGAAFVQLVVYIAGLAALAVRHLETSKQQVGHFSPSEYWVAQNTRMKHSLKSYLSLKKHLLLGAASGSQIYNLRLLNCSRFRH